MANSPRTKTINSGGALVAGTIYPFPCTIHAISVAHDGGSATWIQVHDSATVPAEGAIPKMVHAIGANAGVDLEHRAPLHFENGVYVCESSTLPTKTLAAAAHLVVHMIIEIG